MHVLRHYHRRIIRPVFRELTKQESPAVLAQRSPQLLVRHPKLLDERSRQQLRELLDRYEVLEPWSNSVYTVPVTTASRTL